MCRLGGVDFDLVTLIIGAMCGFVVAVLSAAAKDTWQAIKRLWNQVRALMRKLG